MAALHPPPMTAPDVPDTSVAKRRREEIVSAASDIIASEGIHRLSLARIEERIGMSRGQLTYYFPAKEEILLAVFDRMLAGLKAEAMADAERSGMIDRPPVEKVRHGLQRMMNPGTTRPHLMPLVHTFLAQIQHRDDYRARLADANAGWRQFLADDMRGTSDVPPEIVASLVMALFQGLGGQLAVDPNAFDRTIMLELCVKLLAPLLGPTAGDRGES